MKIFKRIAGLLSGKKRDTYCVDDNTGLMVVERRRCCANCKYKSYVRDEVKCRAYATCNRLNSFVSKSEIVVINHPEETICDEYCSRNMYRVMKFNGHRVVSTYKTLDI